MSDDRTDALPLESPLGGLERALIDEFLHMRGQTPESLHELAESERRALLGEASVYASGKLSEVDARSKFVHEMHEIRPGRAQTGLD